MKKEKKARKRRELELVIVPRKEDEEVTRNDIVKELSEFFYLLYYEQ